MANRSILHIKHVPEFRVWIETVGYTAISPSGPYELMRARKGDDVVIVFKRNTAKEHATVQSKDVGLVRKFLKERSEKNREYPRSNLCR